MIRNIIKTLFRVILRNKTFSVINILGLSVGMSATILILLYIYDEYQYDKFHENIEQIYYLPSKHLYGTEDWYGSGVPPMVAPTLKEEYPEVKYATRTGGGGVETSLSYEDINLFQNLSLTDKDLFQIFSFDFIYGDKDKVFDDMNEIVLSESMAKQYFKDENPIGKTLRMQNQFDLEVVGVYKDLPETSSLDFEAIAPLELMVDIWGSKLDTWYNCAFYSYVLLEENTDVDAFAEKIQGIVKAHDEESNVDIITFPFKNDHLYSVSGSGGRITTVRTFAAIAILILVIACINFMNLSTARASMRSREVGIRKVVGANRKTLIIQFFGEAIFLALLSHIIAMIIVELVLPGFNVLANKYIEVNYTNILFIAAIFFIIIFTGLLAGSYPALFLSSFNPIKVLKGSFIQGSTGALFRKILVILQFTVSVVLIICTIVILKQFKFFLDKDLGLNKDQVVYIDLQGPMKERAETFMNDLKSNPNIVNMSLASHVPTGIWWNGSGWLWDGKPDDVDPLVTFLFPDYEFLNTFDIKMKEGRYFAPDYGMDSTSIIINHAFAKMIDSVSALNKTVSQPEGTKYRIVGVVEDFHFKNLSRRLGPLMLFYEPNNFRKLFFKLDRNNYGVALNEIEEKFHAHYPDFPFQLRFLDQEFKDMYASTNRRAQIFGYFAFFAILISCLGLFGLAQFIAERKTKEIGIKKAFGASYKDILITLLKDFGLWIIISNIIAWPIAYYFMNNWLEDYPYQIKLSLSIFLIGTVISILIAALTVMYNTIKSARQNPITALKYE